ncbi:esterase/lipase family protein [Rubrivivax gelatinosus]|uniref:Lipase n=1 Tax=Rubrivivax gelatinosus TaxID=28068 RepID=A0ABS1DRR1_RUBGE|nr:triacylglycerol lipase [Rubrivivax gelatinosus]MBK1711660.1 lipase [Rubrivivax gelatinosus]
MKPSPRIRVRCASLLIAAAAALLPAAASADTYTQTRYPIVLVHGMLGFGAIGPVDYFYGVPAALRSGGALVYTPSVSALESSEARGEQLLAQLRQLQAAYGYRKFNLVGHSHGGPTARYVAAVAPELVASVTTVGSPHTGSPVADGIQALAEATGLTRLVAAIVDALGVVISWISGASQLPQDALGSLTSLNSAGAAAFNTRFPQGAPTTSCGQGPASVNGVRYYSAGGTSVVTNILDPGDAFLALGAAFFGGQANDGLVGRCSSHWGMVLRDDYGWNHLDEVNQALGLRNLFASDPVAFYRSQANRLKQAGL